ncbi:MAG: hypothetical protein ACI8VC_000016 [Candidatus Endobugula sp.]|jgi:hypothetical protein
MTHYCREKNIPPEQCICIGDIVAYCGQPAETVNFNREWGVIAYLAIVKSR